MVGTSRFYQFHSVQRLDGYRIELIERG